MDPEDLKKRFDALATKDPKEVATFYNALRTWESDYDKAQSTLRTIASAWMIATVGALGLLLKDTPTGGTNFVSRQVILCAATIGLLSLWYLDQRIYQRLLHSVFALGCWFEQSAPWLPPIRTSMYMKNFDITRHLGNFYKVPVLTFVVFGMLNVLFSIVLIEKSYVPALTLCTILFCLQALLAFAVHLDSQSWPSLDKGIPPELSAARPEKTPPHPLIAYLWPPRTLWGHLRTTGRDMKAAFRSAEDRPIP